MHDAAVSLMNDATLDVVRCESCRTPMLTYYTADRLITYACPNCIDWSASETKSDPGPLFIN